MDGMSAAPMTALGRAQTDQLVIAACQRGEREAFRVLFEKYKDKVYSIALHFTGNEATARDVTQEVFLKLFTRIRQFRGEASFSTWLYRMVANACVDEQRKGRRLVPYEPGARHMNPSEKKPQEERFFQRQIAEAVQGALRQLKPSLRMPLLLRYVQGLSYQEIGDVLGCTAGTVASRLNRGHKLLARALTHLRGELKRG